MSDFVKCPNCGFRAKEGYRCGNCGDQIPSSYTDPDAVLFGALIASSLFFGTFFLGAFTFYRSKRGGSIWWSIITIVFSVLIWWAISSALKDVKAEMISTNAKGYNMGRYDYTINFFTFNLVFNAIGLILGAICFFKKIFK
jgi:uncharacterized protein (DUF983 family)